MRSFIAIFTIFLIFFHKKSKAAVIYSNNFETGYLGQIQNAQVIKTEGYNSYGFGNYDESYAIDNITITANPVLYLPQLGF